MTNDIYDKFKILSTENSNSEYKEVRRYYGKLKNLQEAFPDIVFSSFLAFATLNEEKYNFVITVDNCSYDSSNEDQEIKIIEGYEDNSDKVLASILGKEVFIKKNWIKDVETKIEKIWSDDVIVPTLKNINEIYKKYEENTKCISKRIKQEKFK